MTRRHAAQVTADRLAEAIETWPDRFTTQEVASAQGLVRRLQQIAAHDRTDTETGWRCSCGASVSLPGHEKSDLDELFTDHASESAATEGTATP